MTNKQEAALVAFLVYISGCSTIIAIILGFILDKLSH